jgi:copper oxidase (laccase) domain-containing protein
MTGGEVPPLADLREGGEIVESFRAIGVTAFTTGRAAGSFGTQSEEPVSAVMGRWSALRSLLGAPRVRLATAAQVHGAHVIEHRGEWRGWLRGDEADGHLSLEPNTAMQ